MHFKAHFDPPKTELTKALLIMKFTVIIILAACLQVSARVNSQTITLSGKNTSLEKIFREVKQQTGYDFWYESKLLKNAGKVDIQVTNASLEHVLQLCFRNQPLTYTIVDRTIIVNKKTGAAGEFAATSVLVISVSGNVRDADGQPLQGASVKLKGSNTGTSTDANGHFELQVPDRGGVLEISFVGYQTVEVAVSKSNTSVQITLTPLQSKIDEVVVVGYGTQRRKDLTGSVSSISTEEIAKVPVTTISQALQGRSSGVNIINNDGAPDGGTQIQIRGIGSLGNNDPLIVVDGYPISGGLNTINPNDIASIDILKDASATAIYGNRAANGVVIINTKRGGRNGVQLSLDAVTSVQAQPKMHDMLNAQQWGELVLQLAPTEGITLLPEWNNPSALRSLDWQDAIYRQGLRQNYNIALRGGNDKTQTAFSAGYLDHKGIVLGSTLKRVNLSLNLDYNAYSWLKSSSSFKYTRGDNKSTIGTGSIGGINKLPPSMTGNMFTDEIKDAEGNYGFYNPLNPSTGGYNPVFMNDKNDQRNHTNTFLGTTSLEATIAKGLRVKTNFGINTIEYSGYNFQASDNRLREQYGLSAISALSRYSQSANNTFEWLWENTVSYIRTFGDHSIDFVAGVSAQKNTLRQLGIGGEGSVSDELRNAESILTVNSQFGNQQTFSLASQFGRINYRFKDRYLVTATVRRDGSSRFAPGNQYGVFPSGSVAWRVSEEPFMQNVNAISDLKFRASYGEVGNQSSIGLFQYLSTYSTGGPQISIGNVGYPFNKEYQHGLILSALPNPDLKWETTKLTDFGVDMAFLDGDLRLTVDYYIKESKDFLLNIPVPAQTGFTTAARNVGSIRNKGFEFVVDYRKTAKDFTYGANLNFSTINNELLSLTEGKTAMSNFQLNEDGLFEIGGSNSWTEFSLTKVGGEVGEFYGYRTDGIFQTQKEIDDLNAIAEQEHGAGSVYQGTTVPGDRKFVDVNGDGWVTPDDRVALGSPIPDFFGSLNLDASYKAFDINFFFYGVSGNKIFNYNQSRLEDFGGLGNITKEYLNNAWTPSNPSDRYSRVAFNDFNKNRSGRPSDVYVEDGSYLRLRSVQLGYTLPFNLTNKVAISRARVYVSAQNLFTITNYSGLDPEIGLPVQRNGARNVYASGVDLGTYPTSRFFTFGLNVTF